MARASRGGIVVHGCEFMCEVDCSRNYVICPCCDGSLSVMVGAYQNEIKCDANGLAVLYTRQVRLR